MRGLNLPGIAIAAFCGTMLFSPLHADDAAETILQQGMTDSASLARTLGCGSEPITLASPIEGATRLSFVPVGENIANWSRKVTSDLIFIVPDEDNDIGASATESKDAFLDMLAAKYHVTAKKQSERANGTPLIYAEFNGGKNEGKIYGAALFEQHYPALFFATLVETRGAPLDDTAKNQLKQTYQSLDGR